MHPLVLLLALVFFTAPSHTTAAEFKVGASSRIVTPSPLLPVSGGVGPSQPTSRKLGELEVRALVITDGTTTTAIVSTDFLGFPSALGNKVRDRVKSIPADHILIGATHTHSAPDCYGFPGQDGKSEANLPYLDSVCARIVEAIEEARSNALPARLKSAVGDARGKIAYNAYAEALFDPRCHVLQFLASNNTAIATLVNYAIHPEVLGPGHGSVSPDLVGPLRERIHSKGGGLAIFMNGAQGGMVTADNRTPDGRDISTWEECQRIGFLLADEALRIVSKAPVEASPQVHVSARNVEFPVESPLLRNILRSSPLNLGSPDAATVSTTVNLINIGSAQLLTIPGEALPNIGALLKRKMRGANNLLLGLTNDAFGYILTRADWGAFRRYEYISRTSLGEQTGELFINTALDLILQTPAPPLPPAL